MKIQTVILAAGLGTRIGGNIPKVLLLLKGKPLISYVVDAVSGVASMPKPIVVIGPGADQVKNLLGNDCDYIQQDDQLGTAHAVQVAEPKISADNVLVLYGDAPCITSNSLKKLIDSHLSGNSVLTMFTAVVPGFSGDNKQFASFGRIIRDSSGKLARVVEYKDATDEERQVGEINPGIYVFNSVWLWSHLPEIKPHNQQGEYYLTDLVEIALAERIRIQTAPIDPEQIRAVNTLEDLAYLESNFSSF